MAATQTRVEKDFIVPTDQGDQTVAATSKTAAERIARENGFKVKGTPRLASDAVTTADRAGAEVLAETGDADLAAEAAALVDDEQARLDAGEPLDDDEARIAEAAARVDAEAAAEVAVGEWGELPAEEQPERNRRKREWEKRLEGVAAEQHERPGLFKKVIEVKTNRTAQSTKSIQLKALRDGKLNPQTPVPGKFDIETRGRAVYVRFNPGA